MSIISSGFCSCCGRGSWCFNNHTGDDTRFIIRSVRTRRSHSGRLSAIIWCCDRGFNSRSSRSFNNYTGDDTGFIIRGVRPRRGESGGLSAIISGGFCSCCGRGSRCDDDDRRPGNRLGICVG